MSWSISLANVDSLLSVLPARCSMAWIGRQYILLVPGMQIANPITTQLLPLAVATRLAVEATASRNQPKP